MSELSIHVRKLSAGRPSRRTLLQLTAGGFAAAGWNTGQADDRQTDNPRRGTILAYVGTYTPNGQGIHQFSVDPGTGKLTQTKVFPAVNPSWISFSPDKKFLYAANEISNFNGGTTGAVSAYSVSSTGDLTLLNTISSGGAGPAHCSVHPSGKYVFVANYGGGNVAVLPVRTDGALLSASDIQADANTCSPGPCAVGPTHAAKAPPGSFAISGHDAPHGHMIASDPNGNYVIANDLGLDRTIVWKFDAVAGRLLTPRTIPSSAGGGPRHFAFHPNGRWFYSINEEASTLTFMTYDASTGTLSPQEEIATVAPGFVGTNFTSEVIVSPDGNFVYGLNRLHDTIAVFALSGSGRPRLIDEESTLGDYPRSCGIEPNGDYFYSCNHRGDSISIFRITGGGGNLRFTGHYAAVGSPAVITFLRV